MKIFIALLLIATLTLAEIVPQLEETAKNQKPAEQPNKAKADVDLREKYMKECVEELKISADNLAKYEMFYRETGNFSDDANFQCIVKCFLEKSSFFDKENGFNIKQIKSKLLDRPDVPSPAAMDIVLQKCNKEAHGANPCESAYRGFMCFVREGEKEE